MESVQTVDLEKICRDINDHYIFTGSTPINGVGYDENNNAILLYLDFPCKKIVKQIRREYREVKVKDIITGEDW